MGHLRNKIKEVLEKNESVCLNDPDDKKQVARDMEMALYPLLVAASGGRLEVGWTATRWAQEAHRLAVEKGWWEKQMKEGANHTDPDLVKDEVPVKLNLMHDEVSEASSFARSNDWDVFWVIDGWGRVSLDNIRQWVFGAYEGSATARANLFTVMSRAGMSADSLDVRVPRHEFLEVLVSTLCKKYKPDGFAIEVVDNIIRSLDLLEALGFDTEALMKMKHTYNTTRPHRHGNKRY